jgi:iron complex transport system permease protein
VKASPRPLLLGGLVLLALALSAASLLVGKVTVPLSAWLQPSVDPRWLIITELRLPRTVLALAVGATLGLSGAALQGYTRNPLAEPSVLGVSAMAAFGAVLTLYLGAAAAYPWATPVAAMLGAGAGVVFLLLLSGSGASLVTFVLAGAILNVVASAGVALALSLAPNPWAVGEIVSWLMGSLADRSWDDVRFALPFMILGGGLMLATARALDALTLGEAGARSLGVDLARTRALLGAGVALACGASVAVTGVIGFVGLVVPHVLRPLVGSRPGALLWPSALAGAALTVAADIVVRLAPSAAEVKLGIAMAALGGPFFLALLIGLRRRLA